MSCELCGEGTSETNPGAFIGGVLATVKITEWADHSGGQDNAKPAPLHEANAVTSERGDGTHALLLDLDVPAYLVPSGTPGHSHLYVDVSMTKYQHSLVLQALGNAGVIQMGYASGSIKKGWACLRLPWKQKKMEL